MKAVSSPILTVTRFVATTLCLLGCVTWFTSSVSHSNSFIACPRTRTPVGPFACFWKKKIHIWKNAAFAQIWNLWYVFFPKIRNRLFRISVVLSCALIRRGRLFANRPNPTVNSDSLELVSHISQISHISYSLELLSMNTSLVACTRFITDEWREQRDRSLLEATAKCHFGDVMKFRAKSSEREENAWVLV